VGSANLPPICAECEHPYLCHCELHLGGCLGLPGHPCGPDCRDECFVDGCTCRNYVPAGPRAPSTGGGGTT
jgi:hypothetical protein